MNSDISMTNESFSFLSQSSDFLNMALNNIKSSVLLLDKEMRLKAYNNALKTIFSNKRDEDLLYVKCGEAIGCAYQVDEEKECGTTSKCCDCELRIAALTSYVDGDEIYNDHIVKPFFTREKVKVDKHLQFSTRLFLHGREKYIMMIVEDISRWHESSSKLNTDGDKE
jgi:sigma-B regulation protein RsbU (phosphoserine phosphatase)